MLTFSNYDTPEDRDLIGLMIRRINAATVINIGAAVLLGVVALFAPFWKALLVMMGALGRRLG